MRHSGYKLIYSYNLLQVIKIRQDTVDLYLQDIITEGMEFTSESEARNFAFTLADKIDKETEKSMQVYVGMTKLIFKVIYTI